MTVSLDDYRVVAVAHEKTETVASFDCAYEATAFIRSQWTRRDPRAASLHLFDLHGNLLAAPGDFTDVNVSRA